MNTRTTTGTCCSARRPGATSRSPSPSSCTELWNGRDEGCTGMILTTLPWSRHVSAQLLEGHQPNGRWNLHLHMKWPSKLHAALRTCDAVTRTHCCPLSRSSVALARSALKCKACAVNEPLGCNHSLQPSTSTEHGSPREPTLMHKCASETLCIEATFFVSAHNEVHFEYGQKRNYVTL